MHQKNIRLMYAMAVLHGMIFYGPIATLYRQAAGVNVFQIAQIESISLVLCIALEVPWGIVADKIGYRKTLLICCGVYFVSKLVFWRADGYAMFLLERVLLAVSVAGFSGVDTSILYLSAGEKHAQRVFGVYNNCNIAGLIAASGVYILWIGDDYRLAGLLTVVSYGLATAIAFGLSEVKAPGKAGADRFADFRCILGNLWGNKRLLLLLLAVGLMNETQQFVTVFLNQLQYVRVGMPNRVIGAAYLAVTVAGLVGGLSAKATHRLKPKKFGSLLFAASGLACAVLALTGGAWLSFASILMMRVCFSLLQPLQTDLQNRYITSENRATALSVNALLLDGVAIVVNLSLGGVAELNLPLAMGTGALFCLTGLLLFALSNGAKLKHPQARADVPQA